MTVIDGLATQAWLDRDETALAGVLSRASPTSSPSRARAHG